MPNPSSYNSSSVNKTNYQPVPNSSVEYRLLEDGSYRLLEDGSSKRILESGLQTAANYAQEDTP